MRYSVLFMMTFLIAFVSNADLPKKVTMPDGSVYEDPQVLGETPEGLEIGHKHGITYWKFRDLPEEVQKKYGYDPKKAENFREQRDQAKKRRATQRNEEKRKKEKSKAKWDKYWADKKLDDLENEIIDTEKRVEFLKSEIPKLEKQLNQYLDKGTKVSKNTRGSNFYGWRGGFVRRGGASNSTQRRVVSKLGDEYAETKKTLKKYKAELTQKEADVAKMRKRLAKVKAKRKNAK